VSSDAAGRLLGLSTMDPGVGKVLSELLDRGHGLNLTEREAAPAEIGLPARQAAPGALAVLRDGQVIGIGDPEVGCLLAGDRIVLVAAADRGPVLR